MSDEAMWFLLARAHYRTGVQQPNPPRDVGATFYGGPQWRFISTVPSAPTCGRWARGALLINALPVGKAKKVLFMSGDKKRILTLIVVSLVILAVGSGIVVAMLHTNSTAPSAPKGSSAPSSPAPSAATSGGAQNSSIIVAVLGFIGVVLTGSISFIGYLANRQAERRLGQERKEQGDRLQLDAAMRAGELLSGTNGGPAAPEVIASGLLALTKLNQEGLAVTLLVDLWNDKNNRVSPEAAILVIDAALRSDKPGAQLVAAEVLCRNATRLKSDQSLHWPSAVEGSWNSSFSARTKLLIVQALVNMTLACRADESALRAVAVRLYGIWDSEDSESPEGRRVRGCIGKMLKAITQSLEKLGYRDFIQGNREVTLDQLCRAAVSANTNPDGFLDQMSDRYAHKLRSWARSCDRLSADDAALPYLASAECGSSPLRVPNSKRAQPVQATG
jgi:hypothetical protein